MKLKVLDDEIVIERECDQDYSYFRDTLCAGRHPDFGESPSLTSVQVLMDSTGSLRLVSRKWADHAFVDPGSVGCSDSLDEQNKLLYNFAEFCREVRYRLELRRLSGYTGWDDEDSISTMELNQRLQDNCNVDDWVDVAAFAFFLRYRQKKGEQENVQATREA